MSLRRILMELENLLNAKVLKSAGNAFLIALIAQFVDAGADVSLITAETLGTILNSAVTAAAWVVIRAVNPIDHAYGLGMEKPKPARKAAVKKAVAKKK
jgi:hypothetical protein